MSEEKAFLLFRDLLYKYDLREIYKPDLTGLKMRFAVHFVILRAYYFKTVSIAD